MNNKEKKAYLSLYMLQNAKIKRLKEMARLNPADKARYSSEIAKSKTEKKY